MPAARSSRASKTRSSARSSKPKARSSARKSGGTSARSSKTGGRGRSTSRTRASSRRRQRSPSSSDSERSRSRSRPPPSTEPKLKRAMTAYQAFIQTHMKNVSMDRAMFTARSKDLATQWKTMTDEQKAPYQAKADEANVNRRPIAAARRQR